MWKIECGRYVVAQILKDENVESTKYIFLSQDYISYP